MKNLKQAKILLKAAMVLLEGGNDEESLSYLDWRKGDRVVVKYSLKESKLDSFNSGKVRGNYNLGTITKVKEGNTVIEDDYKSLSNLTIYLDRGEEIRLRSDSKNLIGFGIKSKLPVAISGKDVHTILSPTRINVKLSVEERKTIPFSPEFKKRNALLKKIHGD